MTPLVTFSLKITTFLLSIFSLTFFSSANGYNPPFSHDLRGAATFFLVEGTFHLGGETTWLLSAPFCSNSSWVVTERPHCKHRPAFAHGGVVILAAEMVEMTVIASDFMLEGAKCFRFSPPAAVLEAKIRQEIDPLCLVQSVFHLNGG